MKSYLYAGMKTRRLPPIPPRLDVLRINYRFQGETFDLPDYGPLPWWEVMAWLEAPARREAYAIKDRLGDTHVILDLMGAYREPGTPYNDPRFGQDFSDRLPEFRALCLEALCRPTPKWIDLRLGGDGQGYDPVGLTRGFDWLMSNFERIARGLGEDLWPYIIWGPGYDGIFYGWSPEQVEAFGELFRAVIPNGYLLLETDKLPLGEGGPIPDFGPGGRMRAYDVVCSEFNGWVGAQPLNTFLGYDADGHALYPGNAIWQICGRLSRDYRRPADQPANADHAIIPFMLQASERGRRVHVVQEYDTYRWVHRDPRGNALVSAAGVALERQYFYDLGVECVC